MATAPSNSKISVAEALAAARETRALEMGEGILSRTPQLFRQLFGDQPAVLIADPNTQAVAGKQIADAFRAAGHPCEPQFLFEDPSLYAEYKFVSQLEAALRAHQAIPVAIGSGTINDVTKLAAHRVKRPYLCVATAASMDGYTAYGASITCNGSKQTFDCPAPAGVLADIGVIRKAPPKMTASGYADLLAKITAGADWILAGALGVEPIEPQAWRIVQSGLRESLSNPAGARDGDPRAITLLTEGLVLGGFAMQWAKTSRPASGAEHQFSHLWDMEHHTHNGAAPSHGFKVGIGTIAVAALYEHLFTLPIEKCDVEHCVSQWPTPDQAEVSTRKLFDVDELAAKAVDETRAKTDRPEVLRDQLNRLREVWPDLKSRLRDQLIPVSQLREMLASAGAPTEPGQIGISRERFRRSFIQAAHIRRRFTVLDLAIRTGNLDSSLDFLFGPAGPWPLNT